MGELRPSRSRATSRARTQSRSRSRRRPSLDRVFSARHIDDQSVYHAESEHDARSEDVTDDSDDDEGVLGREKTETDTEEEARENRDGIQNEKDVETPRPKLEKKQTTRSVKDPNIV